MTRWFAGLFLVLLTVVPAAAQQVQTPPGMRVGLVPPPGFALSQGFTGFEGPDGATIIILEMPSVAFKEIRDGLSQQALARQGVSLVKSDPVKKPYEGLLVRGEQERQGVRVQKWILAIAAPDLTGMVTVNVPLAQIKRFPEAAIRAALGSVQVAPPPDPIAALPFDVPRSSLFKPAEVIGGDSLLMTRDGKSVVSTGSAPIFIISRLAAATPQNERERLARNLVAATPGVTEIQVRSLRPVAEGNLSGNEIVAECLGAKSRRGCTLFQTVLFGPQVYYRLVGITPREDAGAMLTEFREIVRVFHPK